MSAVLMSMTMSMRRRKTVPVGLLSLLLVVAVVMLALALSSADARRSDGAQRRTAERRAMYRQYTGWKAQYGVMHERGSEEDLDTFENYEANMEALREWREQSSRSATQATVGGIVINAGSMIMRSTFLNAITAVLNLPQVHDMAFGAGPYDMGWYIATKAMFYNPYGAANVTDSGFDYADADLPVCHSYNATDATQCASTQTDWRLRMASWVAQSWQKQPMDTKIQAEGWIAVTIQLLNSYGTDLNSTCAAEAGGELSGTDLTDWNSLYDGLWGQACDAITKRSDNGSEPFAAVERSLADWRPEAWDWHTQNFTRNGRNFTMAQKYHVQDQGKSNTCWAFAVAEHYGTLNTALGGDPVYFAVGHYTYCRSTGHDASRYPTGSDPLWSKMVNWGSRQYTSDEENNLAFGSPNDIDRTGTSPDLNDMAHLQLMSVPHNGGFPMSVTMWSAIASNINTRSGAPATSSSSGTFRYDCWTDALSRDNIDYSTNGYYYNSYRLIRYGNEPAVYDVVRNHPVINAIDASRASFILYKSGTYLDAHCSQVVLTHCVTTWGLAYDECGSPYWIVRNSWGHRWGNAGEIRMIAGRNQCGLATFATYAVPTRLP